MFHTAIGSTRLCASNVSNACRNSCFLHCCKIETARRSISSDDSAGDRFVEEPADFEGSTTEEKDVENVDGDLYSLQVCVVRAPN